jgi:hypothetical protein
LTPPGGWTLPTADLFISTGTTSRLLRRALATDGRPSRKSVNRVGSAFFVPGFVRTGALFGVPTLLAATFLVGVALAGRLTAGDRRGMVAFFGLVGAASSLTTSEEGMA